MAARSSSFLSHAQLSRPVITKGSRRPKTKRFSPDQIATALSGGHGRSILRFSSSPFRKQRRQSVQEQGITLEECISVLEHRLESEELSLSEMSLAKLEQKLQCLRHRVEDYRHNPPPADDGHHTASIEESWQDQEIYARGFMEKEKTGLVGTTWTRMFFQLRGFTLEAYNAKRTKKVDSLSLKEITFDPYGEREGCRKECMEIASVGGKKNVKWRLAAATPGMNQFWSSRLRAKIVEAVFLQQGVRDSIDHRTALSHAAIVAAANDVGSDGDGDGDGDGESKAPAATSKAAAKAAAAAAAVPSEPFVDSRVLELLRKPTDFSRAEHSLTELVLDDSWQPLSSVVSISVTLRSHSFLRVLSMRHCGLLERDMDLLSGALPTNDSLFRVDFSDNPIGMAGACLLANGLRRNRSITTVWVNGCDMQPAGCSALIVALAQHPSVLEVECRNNCAQDITCDALASMVEKGQTGMVHLVRVDLAANQITSAGATALSTVVGAPGSQLAELDLSQNAIGDEGACALAASLRRCGIIRSLDLGGNPGVAADGCRALAHAAQVNRSLQKLDFASYSLNSTALASMRLACQFRPTA